ncbi:chemotaxis protein CheW [Variovorax sp. VNK109]|jgi:twitching motility protein PilI|uniref:chemotaxis protein CheW n=1 Tax=Variovorax sp. VNK109 TaxID=3400919 RepID=UPI003C01C9BF
MAKREALREFQSRLTERLQAARTSGVAASWLGIEAAGGKYLFPLSQSGEIFSWTAMQRVPYTQPWYMGVANLRGGLYGVVNLGGFVTGQAAQLPQIESVHAQARIVALSPLLEINCALLVDRLLGLRGVEAFATSAPAPEGSPGYFGSSYTEASGDSWQEINLQSLSQQARFLSIGA